MALQKSYGRPYDNYNNVDVRPTTAWSLFSLIYRRPRKGKLSVPPPKWGLYSLYIRISLIRTTNACRLNVVWRHFKFQDAERTWFSHSDRKRNAKFTRNFEIPDGFFFDIFAEWTTDKTGFNKTSTAVIRFVRAPIFFLSIILIDVSSFWHNII